MYIISIIKNIHVFAHWGNIVPTVILTPERIEHIKEGHYNDYNLYGHHIPEAIENPTYILEDSKNENTAMFIKHIEETNINVVVKLAFANNINNMHSSVITMYPLGIKTLKRIIKKNSIIYKADNP